MANYIIIFNLKYNKTKISYKKAVSDSDQCKNLCEKLKKSLTIISTKIIIHLKVMILQFSTNSTSIYAGSLFLITVFFRLQYHTYMYFS